MREAALAGPRAAAALVGLCVAAAPCSSRLATPAPYQQRVRARAGWAQMLVAGRRHVAQAAHTARP